MRTSTSRPRPARSSILLLICCWLWIVGPCAAAAPTVAKKVVLIATPPDHPWGSHMYLFDCRVLAKCLEQTPGIDAEVHLGWPTEPQVLDGAAAIVCYSRPAGEIVLAPQNRTQFERLMRQGVGYAAIHWATCVGYSALADGQEMRDAYRDFLGGWFRRPPCRIQIDQAGLTQAAADHPVTRGWQDFRVRDEFYLDLVFHPQAKPLVRARIDGQDHTVAWSFQRPESNDGRSFGTVLGHFHENFARAEFRRLLVNGILWTARVEAPATGAPVELAVGDVTLGPPPTDGQGQ